MADTPRVRQAGGSGLAGQTVGHPWECSGRLGGVEVAEGAAGPQTGGVCVGGVGVCAERAADGVTMQAHRGRVIGPDADPPAPWTLQEASSSCSVAPACPALRNLNIAPPGGEECVKGSSFRVLERTLKGVAGAET